MSLDQARRHRLSQHHVELPQGHSVVARDVIGATPRIGGLFDKFVQRDDEPEDEPERTGFMAAQ